MRKVKLAPSILAADFTRLGDQVEEVPLEAIRVPTLVIHGTADEVVPYAQGVQSAKRIPNAQFLTVLEGTHYCVLTHLEMIRPAIMDFLANHPSNNPSR